MKIVTVVVDSLVHKLPAGATIIGAHYNRFSSTYTVDLWVSDSPEAMMLDYEFKIITPATTLDPKHQWCIPVLAQDAPLGDAYAVWRYVE